MTTLAVVFLTYGGNDARRRYARETVANVLENVRFGGDLTVHVADDGSPGGHLESLADLARSFGHSVSTSNAERGGYGRSYNLATQAVHPRADMVLPVEDDWVLTAPLDLDPLAAALEHPDIGCVRLGYLGFTREHGLRGSCLHAAGRTYLVLDQISEEPHVFAGHPRLETVAFERAVGAWPEGLSPGETEFQVCHLAAARQRVAWPMDYPATGGVFQHVGSVRSTDVEEAVA